MRVPFNQIFQQNSDGSISPRVQVHINGVTMGPGVSFGSGVAFGGVDLTALRGHDLDVEVNDGVYVIKGYFN